MLTTLLEGDGDTSAKRMQSAVSANSVEGGECHAEQGRLGGWQVGMRVLDVGSLCCRKGDAGVRGSREEAREWMCMYSMRGKVWVCVVCQHRRLRSLCCTASCSTTSDLLPWVLFLFFPFLFNPCRCFDLLVLSVGGLHKMVDRSKGVEFLRGAFLSFFFPCRAPRPRATPSRKNLPLTFSPLI